MGGELNATFMITPHWSWRPALAKTGLLDLEPVDIVIEVDSENL